MDKYKILKFVGSDRNKTLANVNAFDVKCKDGKMHLLIVRDGRAYYASSTDWSGPIDTKWEEIPGTNGIAVSKFRPEMSIGAEGKIHMVFTLKKINAEVLYHAYRIPDGTWRTGKAYSSSPNSYIVYPSIIELESDPVIYIHFVEYRMDSDDMKIVCLGMTGNLTPQIKQTLFLKGTLLARICASNKGEGHLTWVGNKKRVGYLGLPLESVVLSAGGGMASFAFGWKWLPTEKYRPIQIGVDVDEWGGVHIVSLSNKNPVESNNVIEYWYKPKGGEFIGPEIVSNNFSVKWKYIPTPSVLALKEGVFVTWAQETEKEKINKVYVSHKRSDGEWDINMGESTDAAMLPETKPALIHDNDNVCVVYRDDRGGLVVGPICSISKPKPSIKITSPRKGEEFESGDLLKITWESERLGGKKLAIRWYSDTYTKGWYTVAKETENDGEYTWDIPYYAKSFKKGSQIEIFTPYEESENFAAAASDSFTINLKEEEPERREVLSVTVEVGGRKIKIKGTSCDSGVKDAIDKIDFSDSGVKDAIDKINSIYSVIDRIDFTYSAMDKADK